MMLNFFLIVLTTLFCLWLLCRLLAWTIIFCARKFGGVEIRIKHIGLFTFGGIVIQPKSNVHVEIERLWPSSSLFNSDIKKPVAICAGDVRVQVELHHSTPPGGTTNNTSTARQPKSLLSILGILQNVGILVENVHIFLLERVFGEVMTNITIQEVTASYSFTAVGLEGVAELDALSARVLKSAQQDSIHEPRIAEFACSHVFKFHIDPQDMSLQMVDMAMCKTRLLISDGLLNLADEILQRRRLLEEDDPEFHDAEDSALDAEPQQFPTVLLKKFNMNISDTEVRLVRENTNRKLKMAVKEISMGLDRYVTVEGQAAGKATLLVKDVLAASPQVNIANLNCLTLETKMDDQSIRSALKVRYGFLGYHHEEMQYWLSMVTMVTRNRQNDKDLSQVPKTRRLPTSLCHKKICVSMELEECSMMVATATSSGLKAGVAHSKCTVSLRLKHRDLESVMSSDDLRVDMEVRSLYWKLTEDAGSSADLSCKLHHWNTILYTGTLIIKANKLSSESTVDCMFDSVQMEWSSSLSSVLLALLAAFGMSQPIADQQNLRQDSASTIASPGGTINQLQNIQINVQCSNINFYICNELKVGTMLRLDYLSCLQRAGEACAKVEGVKVLYFTQSGRTQMIVRSQDLHNYIGHMKAAEITFKHSGKELSIQVSEEMYISWTTALHMCVLSAMHEITDIRSRITGLSRAPSVKPSRSRHKSSIHIIISIRANSLAALKLSKNHRVCISVPEIEADLRHSEKTITIPQASISFDQHDIINIQGIVLTGKHRSKQHQVDRQGFDLQQSLNRAWIINIDKLLIVFPHQYDFAACYEEVVNINKWRKLVHKIVKKPFTADSPLPPDIQIKLKSSTIQLSDDPFEVKLGDNYELLQDEWKEKEKRNAAMDKRIQDLRKKFGLLPASKIDELYASLNKKSAEVYIQRSRQLYATSPVRTKLFSWVLEDVDILALADPSIHGQEKVVNTMKDIDKDTPYPEEGLTFTTLWCRMVSASFGSWEFQLRDFPQPMLDIKSMHMWGRLVGAEMTPSHRAQRSGTVEVGEPWGNVKVTRSMPPLKFYHDFSCDVERLVMTYGPCWEPSIAQYNLVLNLINKASIDPSRTLPFWDKARLLLHGRLTMSVSKMRWLYHAKLDPYNTTEFMDWTWTDLVLDWTNAKWVLKGDLDIYARTASKYDDCRVIHLPNLRLCIRLEWLCVGDPNDHHSVMPCAPDRVPEYSLQEHDSYRAFRSQNLTMSLSFETKPQEKPDSTPSCLFYASTLRWMDQLKMCMNTVSRPIRRGKVFDLIVPKKLQFSRHTKELEFSFSYHQFQVRYWVSFAKQHGMEMTGNLFQMVIGPHQALVTPSDGLIHRPQTDWSINHFTCELNEAAIWLRTTSIDFTEEEEYLTKCPVNKSFFLSLERFTYQRDDLSRMDQTLESLQSVEQQEEKPRHKVQIYDLKGSWTASNRNTAFRLYDGYVRAQTIKKNLAADALKAFKVDNTQTPSKSRSASFTVTPPASFTGTPSPQSKLQSGHVYSMLRKLVSEADSRFVAVSEEVTGGSVQMDQLHGIAACQTDDVVLKNWHIELHNSQIQLRGCETMSSGYVIVSMARASILSCEHQPVWKQRELKGKTTWVGNVDGMQYYATVDSTADISGEATTWVNRENIEDRSQAQGMGLAGMPEMVGSGQSVGGVVSDTVGVTDQETGESPVQLQRIISRCRCQFFYANYGEVDPEFHSEVPPPPEECDAMIEREEGVDSFTLLHHDLNICTNSLQYAMILDIVNNLLLYVEPKKKETHEKMQNLKFSLHLSNMEDQRTPILQRQNNLRELVASIRRLERELYLLHKAQDEDTDNRDLFEQRVELECQLNQHKLQLSTASEELGIMISAFKENQLQIKAQYKTSGSKAQQAPVSRRNEVCFKHAEWRMTEADGQIGIADLVLKNFLYNKINRDDDSGFHHLELGWVKVTNLLPNTLYKDVLVPQDNGQANHQMALRIQCRFKAPVGGISVKEHFEVNVVPLTIQLTHRFYTSVMGFFFPGKNIDVEEAHTDEGSDTDSLHSSHSSLSATSSLTSSTLTSSTLTSSTLTSSSRTSRKRGSIRANRQAYNQSDDIDKMKERAAMNNMFLYVKIPEVPLRLSYKGEKEKNLEDVHDLALLLPTMEYHNQTWTWLDYLMAIKKDSKRVLIGQAVKQKLHLSKSRTLDADSSKARPQEADKARMLLGAKLMAGTEKSTSKKSLFGKSATLK